MFIAGLGFLAYSYYKTTTKNAAYLQVDSKFKEAIVEVNGKEIGKTPLSDYEINADSAEITVKNQFNQFKKEIILSPNTVTSVSVDLGTSEPFSSDTVLWFDKNNDSDERIFISSIPQKAKVSINGNYIGETPLTKSRKEILESGTNQYNIVIEKEGYQSQNTSVQLYKGYTLNITTKLFLNPISKTIKKGEANEYYTVYILSSPYLKGTNSAQWASGLAYWLDTRGATSFDKETINYFDYFIDTEGSLYNGKGDILNKEKVKISEKPKSPLKIAYLDNENEKSPGLTKKAKETLKNLVQEDVSLSNNEEDTYEVTNTGVGYLNVRKEPTVSGELLGKLNVGDKVTVLEKQGEWYKIKYKEGDAWVFGSYLRQIKQKQ